MSISVIIPTLNASALLDPIVGAIREQLTAVREIIVIDSASVDNSADKAVSLGCKVIKINRADFNHGTTRNIAARAASGDVIIFMTQDALPADNRLTRELLVPLQDPQTAASYARQIAAPDAAPVESFSREFNYPNRPILKSLEALNTLGIKTFFFSNVCSAIKREVFIALGGFNAAIMNEDMLFASRLILSGYKVAYCPDAAVIHSHNYSFTKQFKRNFDIGVSLKEGCLLKYASPAGEGLRYLREGVSRLLNEGKYSSLTYFILDTCFRYAGYSMGVRYDLLPKPLRRWMSIHPFYFR
ncbi:glycosyltransferase family 2 protein [Candidatus Magnetominusculus dajiuhuensis]|uniref:glycosyltransferase family 2 protein n=1 Tax=Candidatus Magnetominusculus dajiuhuensis TaxID=3137712 RepID=UPI003B43C990